MFDRPRGTASFRAPFDRVVRADERRTTDDGGAFRDRGGGERRVHSRQTTSPPPLLTPHQVEELALAGGLCDVAPIVLPRASRRGDGGGVLALTRDAEGASRASRTRARIPARRPFGVGVPPSQL